MNVSKRISPPDRRRPAKGAATDGIFTCIYCRRQPPQARPTEAHIVPEALGGSAVLLNAVCGGCNRRIARQIETPARNALAFFQSVWGIKGRSRRPRGVSAILKYAGNEKRIHLDDRGEPPGVVVFVGKDEQRNTTYRLVGHPSEIRRQAEKISRRHPDLIELVRVPEEEGAGIEFRIISDADLIGPILRRLAAKVAFERLAQLRSAAILLEREFDPIRQFILEGTENRQSLCGLLWDEEIIRRALPVDLPLHGICLIGHPADRRLGGFVILYGLFYYWVILSHKYTVLSPWDDTLLIHPQTGGILNLRLREYAQVARIPWRRLLHANSSVLKVADSATAYAIEKLTLAGLVHVRH